MLFSSLTFLLGFLPLSLVIYNLNKNITYKNIVLFILSLGFYAWGEPKTLLLILIVILMNYYLGIKIEDNKTSKNILILGIILNGSLLFFFKYFNFFVNKILMLNKDLSSIILPLGISFYIFKLISYLSDIYTGKTKAERNMLNFANFVLMFPQFIAGPLVRYETIKDALANRETNIDDIAIGLRRFIFGLGKKIIIANQLAIISDKIFKSVPLNEMSTSLAWIGALVYTLQIYFDFSGYSDLAIGLGRMFGFKFLENFNYPYMASSVSDFWKRWHISLSSFFKDYIYIPLGGSRVSLARWILNIFVVWSFTGLWHGASWNFIFWGLYFGIMLVLEKFVLNKLLKNLVVIHRIITLLIIVIGWVLFNSSSASQIVSILSNMFILNGDFNLRLLNNLGILYLWPYVLFGFIGCTNLVKNTIEKIQTNKFGCIIIDTYLLVVLGISLVFLVNSSYNPFIYFKF